MYSFGLTDRQGLLLFFTRVFCFMFLLTFSFETFVPLWELLFPLEFSSFVFMFIFLLLLIFNLISLTLNGYTITTTLSLNLFLGTTYWGARVLLLIFFKSRSFSSLLPLGSPLPLRPFLCVIELVSIFARPVTLCFRLLANMCAGHVILGLIFKANWGIWLLGLPLITLEVLVAFIQAFVFSMLTSVYFQEAVRHWGSSLEKTQLWRSWELSFIREKFFWIEFATLNSFRVQKCFAYKILTFVDSYTLVRKIDCYSNRKYLKPSLKRIKSLEL